LFYEDSSIFHLLMCTHTGHTSFAELLKVNEDVNGNMITGFQTVPSGKRLVYTPMSGGHLKFYVFYD